MSFFTTPLCKYSIRNRTRRVLLPCSRFLITIVWVMAPRPPGESRLLDGGPMVILRYLGTAALQTKLVSGSDSEDLIVAMMVVVSESALVFSKSKIILRPSLSSATRDGYDVLSLASKSAQSESPHPDPAGPSEVVGSRTGAARRPETSPSPSSKGSGTLDCLAAFSAARRSLAGALSDMPFFFGGPAETGGLASPKIASASWSLSSGSISI
mmetsp:Transcript_11456/g.26067  ORF Transcript_11456/g.26067 Transcript_11456/m.26067 type:complete len:212 (+) Transcript_11456:139-774(+)